MCLDCAENQTERQKPMYMENWIEGKKTILKYNYRITRVIEFRAEKLCYLNGILFN